MFGIHDFSLFLAAGILLNLTPGPDTVYILGRSVAQGRGAGVASALGICVQLFDEPSVPICSNTYSAAVNGHDTVTLPLELVAPRRGAGGGS